MQNIAYMDELDVASNLKAVALKLPFKVREKWRTLACDLQERRHGRVRLLDLVDFCDKQVQIYSDPIFGNLTADSFPHQVIKQEISSKLRPPQAQINWKFCHKC